MDSSKTTSLTEEIKKNIRNDRQRLEKLCDDIIRLTDDPDPEVAVSKIAIAKSISFLASTLVQVNNQLIDLVKIEGKGDTAKEGEELSDEDKQQIFKEIGGGALLSS